MGLRGMSLGSILLILVVVLLVFGTKRLRHIGEDLGKALKSFRKGVKDLDESEIPIDRRAEAQTENPPKKAE